METGHDRERQRRADVLSACEGLMISLYKGINPSLRLGDELAIELAKSNTVLNLRALQPNEARPWPALGLSYGEGNERVTILIGMGKRGPDNQWVPFRVVAWIGDHEASSVKMDPEGTLAAITRVREMVDLESAPGNPRRRRRLAVAASFVAFLIAAGIGGPGEKHRYDVPLDGSFPTRSSLAEDAGTYRTDPMLNIDPAPGSLITDPVLRGTHEDVIPPEPPMDNRVRIDGANNAIIVDGNPAEVARSNAALRDLFVKAGVTDSLGLSWAGLMNAYSYMRPGAYGTALVIYCSRGRVVIPYPASSLEDADSIGDVLPEGLELTKVRQRDQPELLGRVCVGGKLNTNGADPQHTRLVAAVTEYLMKT